MLYHLRLLSLLCISTVLQADEPFIDHILGISHIEARQNLTISPSSFDIRQSCPGGICSQSCIPAGAQCCLSLNYCLAGEFCCGISHCAPNGSACCPLGNYALPDEICCNFGSSCPIGTTCDVVWGCLKGGGGGLSTTTRPHTTAAPTSTSKTWKWYTFTVTWSYTSYYYTYFVTPTPSTSIATSTVYRETILSVSTSDAVAAKAWLASITLHTSFPTPAYATTLPPVPSKTTTLSHSTPGNAPSGTGATGVTSSKTSDAGRRTGVGSTRYRGYWISVVFFGICGLVVWL